MPVLHVVFEEGTLSARPPADTAHEGYQYFASDLNGGTLFQCKNSVWIQIAPGINQNVGPAGPTGPGGPTGPAGGLVKISEVVTALNQATVALAGIPQNYRHLRVIGDVYTTGAGAGASIPMSLQVNGVVGNQYHSTSIGGGMGDPVTLFTNNAATAIPFSGLFPAAVAATSRARSFTLDIPLYSSVPLSSPHFLFSTLETNASLAAIILRTHGSVALGVPITSLLFFLGGGYFADGSVVSLYGIP